MALNNYAKTTIEITVASDTRFIEGYLDDGVVNPVYPGMLLRYVNDGGVPKLVPRPDIGGTQSKIEPLIVCVENLEEGKKVGDTYLAGDKIYARHMRPGDVFLGRIHDAITYSIGDPIGPAGTGLLGAGYFDVAVDLDRCMAVCYETITTVSTGELVVLFAK